MLLTVVADYGTGDLAFAEVRQRLALLLPEADVTAIAVPPFDTVSAGFCVAQLASGTGDRRTNACLRPCNLGTRMLRRGDVSGEQGRKPRRFQRRPRRVM